MSVYRWGFESQTNGTPPSVANSSTFGDPAYGTTVSITGSAVCTYSNAHPVIGSMGLLVTAAATETVVLRSPTFTAIDRVAFQTHIYLTAYPTTAFALAQWRTSGGNQFALQIDTAGKVYMVDNAGANQLLATNALPLNTAILLDAYAIVGAANNNSTFKWKATKVSDSSSVDTKSTTTANLNNAAASVNMLVTGQHGKPNSAGAVASMYLDNVAWSDNAADYLAAPSTALSVTATPTPSSGTNPLSVSLSVAWTGGTGTPVNIVTDWGDGSSNTTSSSVSSTPATQTHTYSSPGSFTGTSTVTNT